MVVLVSKTYQNSAKKNKNSKIIMINDIEIIIEAINNGDLVDAIQMLKDIQEDLKINDLIS